MIKAIIIDDEPLARSLVKEYLQGYNNIEVVQECNDGFEGMKAITQHKPELIFLDIQMPKISGFEMLELIEEPPAVIFTTAFDEFAIKAFEANAVDYLLKPFSKERFDNAMHKWLNQRNNGEKNTSALLNNLSVQPDEQNRVVVKTGNQIRIIPVQDINYIEACDDYVKIYSSDGVFMKKKTMQHFEQTLNPNNFVRVHRSYILNLSQITRIELVEKDSHIAIIKSGVKIPLSKTGYGKLKEVLEL